MKGWLDRVWTPGFAYDLTEAAWRGDINGRQPKLTHEKALIIQTTIFDKRAYDAGLREAMRMVIDEFTLTYPGIKNVRARSTSTPCMALTRRRGKVTLRARTPWAASFRDVRSGAGKWTAEVVHEITTDSVAATRKPRREDV